MTGNRKSEESSDTLRDYYDLQPQFHRLRQRKQQKQQLRQYMAMSTRPRLLYCWVFWGIPTGNASLSLPHWWLEGLERVTFRLASSNQSASSRPFFEPPRCQHRTPPRWCWSGGRGWRRRQEAQQLCGFHTAPWGTWRGWRMWSQRQCNTETWRSTALGTWTEPGQRIFDEWQKGTRERELNITPYHYTLQLIWRRHNC